MNPVTNKIYVANYSSANVTVIDGATNTTSSFAAGQGPSSVGANSVTNKIYVGNYMSNTVTVFDSNPVITSSAGGGGSIAPLGTTTIPYLGSQTYSIAANPGFHIDDVLVDGTSVGAASTYTFSGTTSNRSITACVPPDPLPPVTSTPASSDWSLALGVAGALGVALLFVRMKEAASV